MYQQKRSMNLRSGFLWTEDTSEDLLKCKSSIVNYNTAMESYNKCVDEGWFSTTKNSPVINITVPNPQVSNEVVCIEGSRENTSTVCGLKHLLYCVEKYGGNVHGIYDGTPYGCQCSDGFVISSLSGKCEIPEIPKPILISTTTKKDIQKIDHYIPIGTKKSTEKVSLDKIFSTTTQIATTTDLVNTSTLSLPYPKIPWYKKIWKFIFPF